MKDVNGRSLAYQYDSTSTQSQITYPDGTYLTYSRDNLGRLTNISHSVAGSLTSQGYADTGERTYITRVGGGTTYGYDNLGRLTSQTADLPGTANDATWTFSDRNPAGQIMRWSASIGGYDYKAATTTDNRTFNGLNQDTAIAAVSGGGYDANGNLKNDGTRVMVYDLYNRLVSVANAATPTSPYLVLNYDPDGRLSTSTLNGTLTSFLYDGTNLIGEYNNAGTLTERYVHGSGVDEPIVWFHGSDTSDKRYFWQNYEGSVIAYSNSAGVAETYNYGPYGEPQNAAGASTWTGAARFRYTGQTALPNAALYYYKARVYDPAMGRFLQTDPIGSEADLNLYAYVNSDPVNKTDPTGLDPFDPATVKKEEVALANAINGLMAKDGTATVKVGTQSITMTRRGDNVSLTTQVKIGSATATVTISGKYQDVKGSQGFLITNPTVKSSIPGQSFSANPKPGDKTGQEVGVKNDGGSVVTAYKQDEQAKMFGVPVFTWYHEMLVKDKETHKEVNKPIVYELGNAVEGKK